MSFNRIVFSTFSTLLDLSNNVSLPAIVKSLDYLKIFDLSFLKQVLPDRNYGRCNFDTFLTLGNFMANPKKNITGVVPIKILNFEKNAKNCISV